MEVQLPDDALPDSAYALEPRTDAPTLRNLKPFRLWPQPDVVSSVVQAIRIPNLSSDPRTLKRHEHFCQVTPVLEPKEESPSPSPTRRPLPPSHASHSASVQVVPDCILPEAVRANFQSLLNDYDSVFDPQFPGFNGSAGPYHRGGNTPRELLHNWKRVLQALHKCNLRLSAHKTIISPKTTTILGWIWNAGSLSASPHRLNTLATYPEPNTVARLRSFIGAYKVLSRVIPRCSSYLAPLDAVAAGRPSQESINWIDDLRAAFRSAQNALSSALTITLPRPEDQLWIVTDGAVRDPGIGATLYVMRGDKLCVPGFFSTKLWGCQTTWLPCKVEALSIAAATKHFSPYLIQSVKNACILTDSKPCVQAYEKLCRGSSLPAPVYPLSCLL